MVKKRYTGPSGIQFVMRRTEESIKDERERSNEKILETSLIPRGQRNDSKSYLDFSIEDRNASKVEPTTKLSEDNPAYAVVEKINNANNPQKVADIIAEDLLFIVQPINLTQVLMSAYHKLLELYPTSKAEVLAAINSIKDTIDHSLTESHYNYYNDPNDPIKFKGIIQYLENIPYQWDNLNIADSYKFTHKNSKLTGVGIESFNPNTNKWEPKTTVPKMPTAYENSSESGLSSDEPQENKRQRMTANNLDEHSLETTKRTSARAIVPPERLTFNMGPASKHPGDFTDDNKKQPDKPHKESKHKRT